MLAEAPADDLALLAHGITAFVAETAWFEMLGTERGRHPRRSPARPPPTTKRTSCAWPASPKPVALAAMWVVEAAPARRGAPLYPAPRPPGQVVRTISTLQGAWCTTLLGTPPSRNRVMPVMPLLPTTMSSASRFSANWMMTSAGAPGSARVSTATPGASELSDSSVVGPVDGRRPLTLHLYLVKTPTPPVRRLPRR